MTTLVFINTNIYKQIIKMNYNIIILKLLWNILRITII